MFVEPYFIWRNEDCRKYNLSIVTTSKDIINEFGIPYSRTLNKEDITTSYMYTHQEDEPREFTLSLALIGYDEQPMTWTNEVYENIANWLISDDFEQFISYDNLNKVYYLMVTKIQKNFTYDNKGWIDVTFLPLNTYGFEIKKIERTVLGEELINIKNPTRKDYEPLIIIENDGTNRSIVHINDFVITGMGENEVIYVDNYMTNVINQDDENRLYLCNRRWIKLKPGMNQLLVEGDCTITIYCEFPIKN